MRKNISILLLIISFLILGCKFSTTNYNEEEQKEKAEQVADKFYVAIAKRDYPAAEKLCGDEFYKAATKVQLEEFIKNINDNFGDYSSKHLLEWNTINTSGSNPVIVYILIYEVTYKRAKVKERITLKDIGKGIEIFRYDLI